MSEPLDLTITLKKFGSRWEWHISQRIIHRNEWHSTRDCGIAMTREEAIAAANASYDRLQEKAVKDAEEVALITQKFDREAAQWAAERKHE